MKRWILALVAGGVVGSAVFGAAASLGGITADTMTADSTAISPCDNNGVNTSYNFVFDSSVTAYKVTTVDVSNIDAACQNYTLRVTLYNSSNASLAERSGTIGTTGTETLDFTAANIDAEFVTGMAVVIEQS